MDRSSQTVEEQRVALFWHAYLRLGCRSVRNAILAHYLPWLRRTAARVVRRLPASVDEDELVSSGVLGLMDAIRLFDPARGVRFEQFAGRRVRGAMTDGLRDLDAADRVTRRQLRELEHAADAVRAATGRPATADELSAALNLPPKRLRALEQRGRALQTRSFDAPAGADAAHPGDAPAAAARVTADRRAEDPSAAAMRRSLRDAITRDLSREERLVILLYYCEDLKMREIGDVLGLSEARVSQIHKNVVARLRAAGAPELLAA